jgi:hypothetical protein
MTRDEKMELIQRMLGLRHKIKVHDSMKSPETHDEQSVSLLSRWDLEDELKAIEMLLDMERQNGVKEKIKQVEEEYLSGKPRPVKKTK